VLWYRGETASARRLVGDAIALLEREPPGAGLADAYLEMGKEVWTSGRPAEALDWLQRAMDLAESYEGVSLTARKAHILAAGARSRRRPRSRPGSCPAAATSAIPRSSPTPWPSPPSSSRPTATPGRRSGWSRSWSTPPAAATACYRADPLPIVARICRAAGEPGLAERFLQGADAPAARYRNCLATVRAVLAETRGDLPEAASRYDDAGDRWRSFGVALEHGQALLGLGRCVTRLGRPPAREPLLQAQEIFARLGARGLLAETDRWLDGS
jgi:tetratricopeptide (TPR) repeat protein